MKRLALLAAALPLLLAAAPGADRIAALREAALEDDLAWEITEGLTTEIGPRLAGSEAEARARDWAVRKLKSLGFSNVRIEPFDIPYWVRGEERAEVTAPFPQKLAITALGNSGATPAEGLTAEVVGFDGLAALEAASPARVRGKIVFVDHHMTASSDGAGYGPFGQVRRAGPSVAARMGAAAIVIRSIGTDRHRVPHTGVQSWADGVTPIPAAALSVPDAEQLARILARGKPVTLKLVLTPRMAGTAKSGNVIAEVPGSDPQAGMILVGGHLDSWDLGTGAIDDAAGVAITTAAAKRVMEAGRPKRTIRLVWFGSEEIGLFGGKAYHEAHRGELHAAVGESDFGADRIWRFETRFAPSAAGVARQVALALQPLGIPQGGNDSREGSDIEPLIAAGVPVIGLSQDGTRYFDLHHTADDTLDKIDPVQLRQNVAAWTTVLGIIANDTTPLGPVPAVTQP
jgi:carboxypeptidase Q